MFHHFHDGVVHKAGQGSISAEQLDSMIRFLGKNRILPAREWMWRAITGGLHENDLCLTFDDNLRCQFQIALPVLETYNLTAFWFVYSSSMQGNLERLEIYRRFRTNYFGSIDDFYSRFFESLSRHEWSARILSSLHQFDPGRYLSGFDFYTDADRKFRYTRDEVLGPERYQQAMDAMIADAGVTPAELARGLWMDDECVRALDDAGHVIGLHSHTHPTRIENLDHAGQLREYAMNQAYLTDLLGHVPVAMSHPCNSYNDTTLRVLRSLGVTLGFRANMARPAASALEHPREDHANVLIAMNHRLRDSSGAAA